MASLGEVTVFVSDNITAEIEKIKKEVVAVDEARIRAIVREELEAWEKRLLEAQGHVMSASPLQGVPLVHEARPDLEPVRMPKGSNIVPISELTWQVASVPNSTVTLMVNGKQEQKP